MKNKTAWYYSIHVSVDYSVTIYKTNQYNGRDGHSTRRLAKKAAENSLNFLLSCELDLVKLSLEKSKQINATLEKLRTA